MKKTGTHILWPCNIDNDYNLQLDQEMIIKVVIDMVYKILIG